MTLNSWISTTIFGRLNANRKNSGMSGPKNPITITFPNLMSHNNDDHIDSTKGGKTMCRILNS